MRMLLVREGDAAGLLLETVVPHVLHSAGGAKLRAIVARAARS